MAEEEDLNWIKSMLDDLNGPADTPNYPRTSNIVSENQKREPDITKVSTSDNSVSCAPSENDHLMKTLNSGAKADPVIIHVCDEKEEKSGLSIGNETKQDTVSLSDNFGIDVLHSNSLSGDLSGPLQFNNEDKQDKKSGREISSNSSVIPSGAETYLKDGSDKTDLSIPCIPQENISLIEESNTKSDDIGISLNQGEKECLHVDNSAAECNSSVTETPTAQEQQDQSSYFGGKPDVPSISRELEILENASAFTDNIDKFDLLLPEDKPSTESETDRESSTTTEGKITCEEVSSDKTIELGKAEKRIEEVDVSESVSDIIIVPDKPTEDQNETSAQENNEIEEVTTQKKVEAKIRETAHQISPDQKSVVEMSFHQNSLLVKTVHNGDKSSNPDINPRGPLVQLPAISGISNTVPGNSKVNTVNPTGSITEPSLNTVVNMNPLGNRMSLKVQPQPGKTVLTLPATNAPLSCQKTTTKVSTSANPKKERLIAEKGTQILHCKPCGLTTKDSVQFAKHSCRDHAYMSAEVTSKMPTFAFCNGTYTCSGCDFSTQKRKLFSIHVCLHLVPDPCRCHYCNYSTRQLADINNHTMTAHPKKTRTWQIAGNELVNSIMEKLGSTAPLSNTTFVPTQPTVAHEKPVPIMMKSSAIEEDDSDSLGLKIVSVESLSGNTEVDVSSSFTKRHTNIEDLILSINNSYEKNDSDQDNEGHNVQSVRGHEKESGKVGERDKSQNTEVRSNDSLTGGKKDVGKSVKCFYKDGMFFCESCSYMQSVQNRALFEDHLFSDLHPEGTVCGHCHKTRIAAMDAKMCPMVDVVMNLLMKQAAAAREKDQATSNKSTIAKPDEDTENLNKDSRKAPNNCNLDEQMNLLKYIEQKDSSCPEGQLKDDERKCQKDSNTATVKLVQSKGQATQDTTNETKYTDEKMLLSKLNPTLNEDKTKDIHTVSDTDNPDDLKNHTSPYVESHSYSEGPESRPLLAQEDKSQTEKIQATFGTEGKPSLQEREPQEKVEMKKQVAKKGSGPKSRMAKLGKTSQTSGKVLLKCLYENGKFECRNCQFSCTNLRSFHIHVWKDVHRPAMVCSHSGKTRSKQCPIVKQMIDMLIKKKNEHMSKEMPDSALNNSDVEGSVLENNTDTAPLDEENEKTKTITGKQQSQISRLSDTEDEDINNENKDNCMSDRISTSSLVEPSSVDQDSDHILKKSVGLESGVDGQKTVHDIETKSSHSSGESQPDEDSQSHSNDIQINDTTETNKSSRNEPSVMEIQEEKSEKQSLQCGSDENLMESHEESASCSVLSNSRSGNISSDVSSEAVSFNDSTIRQGSNQLFFKDTKLVSLVQKAVLNIKQSREKDAKTDEDHGVKNDASNTNIYQEKELDEVENTNEVEEQSSVANNDDIPGLKIVSTNVLSEHNFDRGNLEVNVPFSDDSKEDKGVMSETATSSHEKVKEGSTPAVDESKQSPSSSDDVIIVDEPQRTLIKASDTLRSLLADDTSPQAPAPERQKEDLTAAKKIRTDQGENDTTYICSIPSCNVATTNPTALKAHMKFAHKNLDCFPCVYCSFKSSTIDQYVRHVSLHGQTQQAKKLQLYRCAVDGCNYSTGISNEFNQHNISLHPTAACFRCWYCSKIFPKNDLLMAHLLSNVMRAVLCPYCKVTVKFRPQMLQHLGTVHPNEPKRILVGTKILCKKEGENRPGLLKIPAVPRPSTSLHSEQTTCHQPNIIKASPQGPGESLLTTQMSCPKCNFTTFNRSQLAGHMMQCAVVNPVKMYDVFTCPHCGEKSQDHNLFLKHSAVCSKRLTLKTNAKLSNKDESYGSKSQEHLKLPTKVKISIKTQQDVSSSHEKPSEDNTLAKDSAGAASVARSRKSKLVPRNFDDDLKSKPQDIVEKYFDCTKCPYKTVSASNLNRHLQRHDSPPDKTKPFLCKHCGFGTETYSVFVYHMAFHQETSRVRIYRCYHCVFSTNQMSGIEEHLEESHPSLDFRFEVSQKIVEAGVFSCAFCMEKSVKGVYLLWRHISEKHGEEKLQQFSKGLAEEDRLSPAITHAVNKHKRTAETLSHPENSTALRESAERIEETTKGRLSCKFCPYTNNSMQRFTVHVATHLSINNNIEVAMYQCKLCRLTSTSNRLIREHAVKTHRGKLTSVVVKTIKIKGSMSRVINKHQSSSKITDDKVGTLFMPPSPSLSVQIDRYHCDHCFFSTNSLKTLSSHVSEEHGGSGTSNETANSPEEMEISDKHCGQEDSHSNEERISLSDNPRALSPPLLAPEVPGGTMNIHLAPVLIRRPGGKKLWKCPYCYHDSVKKSNIDRHIEHVHVNKRMKGFACVYCQYECNSKFNISYHQKKYHHGKPLKHKFFDRSVNNTPTIVDNVKGNTSPLKLKIRLPEIKKLPPKLKLEVNQPVNQPDITTSIQSIDMAIDGHKIHIPEGSLFKEVQTCPLCKYESKVRSNFVRHLKLHKEGKIDSHREKSTAPMLNMYYSKIQIDEESHKSSPEKEAKSFVNYNEQNMDKKDIKKSVSLYENVNNEYKDSSPLTVSEGEDGALTLQISARQSDDDDDDNVDDGPADDEENTDEKISEQEWTPADSKPRHKIHSEIEVEKVIIDGKEAYKCPECDFTARFPSKVRRHHDYKHMHYKHFRCGYCDFDGVEKGKVRRHCTIIHRNVPPKIIMLTKDESGDLQESSVTGGDNHEEMPDPGEQSPDSGEPERFNEGSDLSWLSQCYAKLGKNQLRCNYCSYKQEGASSMRRHVLAVHLDFYPYKCKYCDFVAVEKNKIIKHITCKHPGESVRIIIRKWKQKLPPFPGQTEGLDADTDDNLEEELISSHVVANLPPSEPSDKDDNSSQGFVSEVAEDEHCKLSSPVDFVKVKTEPVDPYFDNHSSNIQNVIQSSDKGADQNYNTEYVENNEVLKTYEDKDGDAGNSIEDELFNEKNNDSVKSLQLSQSSTVGKSINDNLHLIKPDGSKRKQSTPMRYTPDDYCFGRLPPVARKSTTYGVSPKKLFGCSFCEYTSKYGRQDTMRHIIVNHLKQHPYKCGVCGKGLQKACLIDEHWRRFHMPKEEPRTLINNMEKLDIGLVHQEEGLDVYGIINEENQAALQQSRKSMSPARSITPKTSTPRSCSSVSPGTVKAAVTPSSSANSLGIVRSEVKSTQALNLSIVKDEPSDDVSEDQESHVSDKTETEIHSKLNVSKKMFECIYCGYQSKWCNSDVRKHISLVHLRMFPFKCMYCPYQSMGKIKMKKHWNSVHKSDAKEFMYVNQEEARISQLRETEDKIFFGADPAANQTIYQHKRLTKAQQYLYKDTEYDGPIAESESSLSEPRSRSPSKTHLDVQIKQEPLDTTEEAEETMVDFNFDNLDYPKNTDTGHTPQPSSSGKKGSCKKQFKCVYCGHASRWNMRDVKKHIYSIHVKQYPFQCGHCTKGTIDKIVMHAHWQKKHPLLPFSFRQTIGREVIPLEEEGDVVMLGVPDLREDEIHMESKQRKVCVPKRASSAVHSSSPSPKRICYDESVNEHSLESKDPGSVSNEITQSPLTVIIKKEHHSYNHNEDTATIRVPVIRTPSPAKACDKRLPLISPKSTTLSGISIPSHLDDRIEYTMRDNRKVNICKECGYSNVGLYKVRRHILAVHMKLYPFRCKYCTYSSVEKFNIQNHSVKQHPGLEFRLVISKVYRQLCPSGGMGQLADNEEMEEDFFDDTDKEDGSASLTTPSPIQKRKPAISPTIKKSIFSKPKQPIEQMEYPCEFCPYIAFSIDLLRKHQIRHYTFRPYGCYYCKYKAYETKQIRNHIIAKHENFEIKIKKFAKPAVLEVRDDFQKGHPTKYEKSPQKNSPTQVMVNGTVIYKCNLCMYKTASIKCLKIHSSRAHKVPASFVSESSDKATTETSNAGSTSPAPKKTFIPKIKLSLSKPKIVKPSTSKLTSTSIKSKFTSSVKTLNTYRCTVCDFQFASKGFIAIHVRKHQQYKPFCCGYCESTHYRRTDAMTHITHEHPNQPIYIKVERDVEIEKNLQSLIEPLKPKVAKTVCPKVPLNPGDREANEEGDYEPLPLELADRTKKYPCPMCPFVVNSLNKLKMHMRSEIGYKPFQCSSCSFRTVDKVQVEKHIRQIHKGELVHITVNKSIEMETKIKRLMTNSLKKARVAFDSSSVKSPPGNKVIRKHGGFNVLSGGSFQCIKCGYVTGKRKQIFNHIARHGPPRYQCGYCDDYYAIFPFEVENHRKSAHPDKPPYAKRIVAETQTEQEEGEGESETDMQDDVMPQQIKEEIDASKSDSSITVLESDEFARDDYGSYMCVEPNCGFKATNKKDMMRHRVTHMLEPIFHCLYCNHKSNYRFNLKKHLRSFHPGQEHKIKRLTPGGGIVIEPLLTGNTYFKSSPVVSKPQIQPKKPSLETVYCCTLCNFKDTKLFNYTEHLDTHFSHQPEESSGGVSLEREESRVPLKCGFCPFVSYQEDVFSRHLDVHTFSRPFKCGHCDHTSFHRSKIKDHSQRIHTGLPVTIIDCRHSVQGSDNMSESSSVSGCSNVGASENVTDGKKTSKKVNFQPTVKVMDVYKMPVHEYMVLLTSNGISNFL